MAAGDVMDAKGLLSRAADHSRFLDAYGFIRRKIKKSQVAIIAYHRVSPNEDSWSVKPLSPQSFEGQIRYFSQNYKVLTLDRLAEYMNTGEPLPDKAVVITIDDGYKDNYRYAYPILKKYNIPATIFLTTGHVGTGDLYWFDKVRYIIHHADLDELNLSEVGAFSLRTEQDKFQSKWRLTERLKKLPDRRKSNLVDSLIEISGVDIPADLGGELILSWDEIREMNNDGISFGAHTVNHPILTNLSLEQAKWEITKSKKDIENVIGHKVTTFAYPNGDFNADIAELVRTSGFACAVAVSPNRPITLDDSLYELGRIVMGDDFSKSKVMLCGLWEDLKGL